MTHQRYPTRLKIFNKKEKERFEEKLNEQFGIENIPGMILQKGTEKLYLFQGSLSEKQIYELEQTLPIEKVGIYFAKTVEERDGEDKIRLSIEGTQILSDQINKNIFELNDEQVEEWMRGSELLLDYFNKLIDEEKLVKRAEGRDAGVLDSNLGGKARVKPERGFLVMKYKDNFLGTGKASENKISNFIPKNRRLKERNN